MKKMYTEHSKTLFGFGYNKCTKKDSDGICGTGYGLTKKEAEQNACDNYKDQVLMNL